MNGIRIIKEQDDKEDFGNIPQNEVLFVETILDKFIVPQDTSNIELVNIKLALKCLPIKVTLSNLKRIEMVDFKTIKLSLISFQNDNQDEIFSYYSSKNKRILLSLKMTQQQINRELKKIKYISSDIEAGLKEKITDNKKRLRFK